ncbi:MAG: PQQ-binding-like beta-propeller repeat protein [Pseudomonadota bacterium]
MTRLINRALCAIAISLLLACGDSNSHFASLSEYSAASKKTNHYEQEWRSYLADTGHSHYSSLAQINEHNVAQLQAVWRFNAGEIDQKSTSDMQCNPLIIKGILYCTSPNLEVFALNASNGKLLWRFDPQYQAKLYLPNPNRGVSYWTNNHDQRILFTAGSALFALDARTGRPVTSFGEKGRVDLRTGLPEWASELDVVATTPGSIFENLLVLGSRVSEVKGAAPGHVRAFDVQTGELKWVFKTIPAAGTYGADTWPAHSISLAGGANSWAGIAIDPALDLAFVPTGSPSFDFHGVDRLGDNLFANSLIALNVRTGKRVWHYQFVKHDLWDRDLPSPPNLIDWQIDGERFPAVAQATKTGHIFVFDRATGKPLTPIQKMPVVGSAIAGDVSAAWQPLPRFPTFTQQVFTPSSRTPAIEQAVSKRLQSLEPYALYRPPGLKGGILYPGIDGGAEWGGMAYDPQRRRLFINANEIPWQLKMVELENGTQSPEYAYLMLCSGCHGTDLRGDGVSVPGLRNLSERMSLWSAWQLINNGRARMPGFSNMPAMSRASVLYYVWTADESTEAKESASEYRGGSLVNAGYQRLLDPENLPASQPPWGSLTAIDLNNGADSAEIAWRIPFGNYPQMLAQQHEGLGSENYGGPIVTAGGLLFIAATPDKLLKAYSSNTGELLWQTKLPFAGFATPSTYMLRGRQFLVIAAGGGKLGQASGSAYVAFALPETAAEPAESR